MMSSKRVVIYNGEEVPEFLYEAIGLTTERDIEIGQFIMGIEKEGGTISDGLNKIINAKRINNKLFTTNEKLYAAYRLGERQTAHCFSDEKFGETTGEFLHLNEGHNG